MKFLQQFFWILMGWICFVQNLSGAGVAVIKEQRFHSDQSAKPFAFSSVKDFGRHLIFETKTRNLSIERTVFIEYIEVPSTLPEDIVTPEAIASIRNTASRIQDFVSRFPLSEPMLRKHLEALRQIIHTHESGFVLYQNKWVTIAEFDEIKVRFAMASALAAQEERERKAEKERLTAMALENVEKARLAELDTSAERDLRENSLLEVEYSFRERVGDGAVIEILGKSGVPQIAFLEDYNAGDFSAGTSYKGNLYYSGSIRSPSAAGIGRMVRTFNRNREFATSRLKARISSVGTEKTRLADSSFTGDTYPEPNGTGYLAGSGSVWVNGYFRSDGTWVSGHYRSAPGQAALSTTPARPVFPSTSSRSSGGSVQVKGYYRKNGTYVRPHTRRR